MRNSMGGGQEDHLQTHIDATPDSPTSQAPLPLRTCATSFASDRQAPKRARGWIRGLLASSCYAPCLDSILTAASELANNAILHSRSGRVGGSFGVLLIWNNETLHVAVQDQGGAHEPTLACPSMSNEAGRGLQLVSSCASRWGWTITSFGAYVWCEFDSKICESENGMPKQGGSSRRQMPTQPRGNSNLGHQPIVDSREVHVAARRGGWWPSLRW